MLGLGIWSLIGGSGGPLDGVTIIIDNGTTANVIIDNGTTNTIIIDNGSEN